MMFAFMQHRLGLPNQNVKSQQDKPNFFNVRLAYMRTWNERLKFAREARGLSAAAFAREVKVSKPTVSDWESGEIKELKGKNLDKACSVLKIRQEWLLHNKGEMDRPRPDLFVANSSRVHDADPLGDYPREPSEEDFALIPQYSVKGSCGNGHLNGHVEINGGLAFKRDWLIRLGVKPEQSAVIYACGESMSPTIGDGYVVLLDLAQTELRNGLIYAFMLDGEVRIKRFFRAVTGQWRMASDNANKTLYPDEPLDEPLALSIIGRAVWQGGGL